MNMKHPGYLLTLPLLASALGCADETVTALTARVEAPALLDLGPVELGALGRAGLEVSNTGSVAVGLALDLSGEDADTFEVIETERLRALEAQRSLRMEVVFRPARLGAHRAELRLVRTDAPKTVVGLVEARGQGVPATELDAGAPADAGAPDSEAPLDAGFVDAEVVDAAPARDASLPPIPDSGVHWRPLTIVWIATPEDTAQIYASVTTLELMLECGDTEGTYRGVPWSAYATGPRDAPRLEATVDVLPAGRCKASVRGRDAGGAVIQWLTGYWGSTDRPFAIGRTEAHAWDGAVYHGVLAPQPDVQREGYVWILQGW